MRTGLACAGFGATRCCVGVAWLGAGNLQTVRAAAGPVRETADGLRRYADRRERPRRTVTVRLIRDGGVGAERRLRLVREGVDWWVCGDPF